MNIYRWENPDRVVEVMALTVKSARFKAMHYLAHSAWRLTLEAPQNMRRCSKSAIGEECVKTWLKH